MRSLHLVDAQQSDAKQQDQTQDAVPHASRNLIDESKQKGSQYNGNIIDHVVETKKTGDVFSTLGNQFGISGSTDRLNSSNDQTHHSGNHIKHILGIHHVGQYADENPDEQHPFHAMDIIRFF